MELKLSRIQKVANIARIVTKVLFVISIVSTVLIIAATVTFKIWGDFEIDLGGITLHGFLENHVENLSYQQLLCYNFCGIVQELSAIFIFFFANRYLKNEVKDSTPFTERGSKELLRLGIIISVASLLCDMIVSIIADVMKCSYSTDAKSEVVIGVVLIALSFIFSYGAELEKNRVSETTLTEAEPSKPFIEE